MVVCGGHGGDIGQVRNVGRRRAVLGRTVAERRDIVGSPADDSTDPPKRACVEGARRDGGELRSSEGSRLAARLEHRARCVAGHRGPGNARRSCHRAREQDHDGDDSSGP